MDVKTNEIKRQKFNVWTVLLRQFKNPLLLVFLISTVVAFLLGQKTEAFVIWIVMTLSIVLGFYNEYQAEKVINDLIKKISFKVIVIRDGIKHELDATEIQIGVSWVYH